jgi:hypothetical protein
MVIVHVRDDAKLRSGIIRCGRHCVDLGCDGGNYKKKVLERQSIWMVLDQRVMNCESTEAVGEYPEVSR